MKRRSQLILILCSLSCGYLILFWIIGGRLEPKKYGRGQKIILLWNSLFHDTTWGLSGAYPRVLDRAYFRDHKCSVTNCVLTDDRNYLPYVQLFHAIVFDAAKYFPPFHSVPAKRLHSQYYVFAMHKSPMETLYLQSYKSDFYNLTMTYRLDSDIVWPLIQVEDIESGAIVAPSLAPAWRMVPDEYKLDEDLKTLFAGKKKFAMWQASKCKTFSKREKLIRRLQEYIKIDICGSCGPLYCPEDPNHFNAMVDAQYLFIFAFEETLCADYISEIVMNAMQRNAIPVILSGADLTLNFPPMSFINVDDFHSPKKLAEYLVNLSQHPKDYVRYFWWRDHYRLTHRSPLCGLCARLNASPADDVDIFYHNIKSWWLNSICYSYKL